MGNEASNLRKRLSNPQLPGTWTASTTSSYHTQTQFSHDKTDTSSTFSNSNSQPNFKWLDGMKYHDREGVSYILPVDGEEIDRLHIQHYILKMARNSTNFVAPVKEKLQAGGAVLDLACGPGSWTLDMASEFPESTFIGIDIADNFPLNVHPKNIKFHTADVNHGLPFADNKFDFIHQRFLAMGLTQDQWPNLLRELFRCLAPGAYFELNETDPEGKNMCTASKKLISAMVLCLQARGINPSILRDMSIMLRNVGFVDVKHTYVSVPSGWGGDIGEMDASNFAISFRGLRPMLVPMLGLKNDQYEDEAAEAVLGNKATKAYFNYHTWTCRKPEQQPTSSPKPPTHISA